MKDQRPILIAKSLAVGYGTRKSAKTILKSINVELYPGELVAFMGQNGVGKSTLLRTLSGVQPALEGVVELKGRPLADFTKNQLARAISLVLTEKINPGNLTVYELISLGRYPHTNWTGNLALIDREKVEWSIEQTRTNYIADRPVLELSDGQMQKALIARALAQDGEIIILDEPTAHLDLTNQVEIMSLLKTLAETTRKAILVSTHELEITLQTSHKLWLANFGKPLVTGIPEDLVLNGALTDTFFKSGFEWDVTTRKFNISQHTTQQISLSGEGPELYWTQQALGRSGYKITSGPGNPAVLLKSGPNPEWRISYQNNEVTCGSLEHLLEALNDIQLE